MDVLEGVIGLGPNLIYGTGLAACILVFRACTKLARKKQVLIVDASRLFRKGRNQNTLEPEHVEQIFQWYRGYTDVPGSTRTPAGGTRRVLCAAVWAESG
jgi:type I restriction enzyme M protein